MPAWVIEGSQVWETCPVYPAVDAKKDGRRETGRSNGALLLDESSSLSPHLEAETDSVLTTTN
jgi:hypothetical protein